MGGLAQSSTVEFGRAFLKLEPERVYLQAGTREVLNPWVVRGGIGVGDKLASRVPAAHAGRD